MGGPFEGNLVVPVSDPDSEDTSTITVKVPGESTDAAMLKAAEGAEAQVARRKTALEKDDAGDWAGEV